MPPSRRPRRPTTSSTSASSARNGLVWRYGTTDVAPEVRERLDKELKVIAAKNFCSYFLIVWDFCNYARENGIPVGARGSGVGTMVGYLLGLCNVDPIRYGLLFERFMDPSRNEMPDIDIDICQDGRQKVIDYVRNKYGHVAQIITFGTLAAKAVCKDVGRVMGVPLAETDKLTKLIPGVPGMTLDKALKQVPELADLYNANPQARQIIDIGKRLEGLARNAGCHAAGVIIADQPLDEVVPLYRDSDGNILTQFEGPIAEKVGLLKMDFLGLRTLSTLTRSVELVKKTKGLEIDVEKLDLTDQTVFGLFKRGETKGIFQFESGGMQDLLMKMQPDRIEDLIAANALYRPGPMELIPLYCNRKHGREKVPQVHPIMDAILAETYGIMVYQEQVMQIFNQLGGIELANAYKLIKAISKKTVDVIAKFKPAFIEGTMAKGVARTRRRRSST
jgi:DNA polymerase-3 subunit alpha